jgi:hypothetical protein
VTRDGKNTLWLHNWISPQFMAPARFTGEAPAARWPLANRRHLAAGRFREPSDRPGRSFETLERERVTAAVAAERAVVTRQSLIEKAEAVYKQALEIGQLGAAVAAAKEIGVLAGIRVERSERGAPGEFDWLDKVSAEDLRLAAAGKLDLRALRERYRQDDVPLRARPLN